MKSNFFFAPSAHFSSSKGFYSNMTRNNHNMLANCALRFTYMHYNRAFSSSFRTEIFRKDIFLGTPLQYFFFAFQRELYFLKCIDVSDLCEMCRISLIFAYYLRGGGVYGF